MKKIKKIIPVLTLMLALVTSFAFTTHKNLDPVFCVHLFVFNDNGVCNNTNRLHNPLFYTDFGFGYWDEEVLCDDPDYCLCALCITDNDVYENGSAKVDDMSAGGLGTRIDAAITAHQDTSEIWLYP